MDYIKQKINFKLLKVIRYLRLYGVRRTLIKVKGQYHMQKRYDHFPEVQSNIKHSGHVAIVGCGNYAYSNIAYYLEKNFKGVIRACMDTDLAKAASLYESYDLEYYTDDIDRILDDKNVDLVYIASNHASHAEYAIRCINAGKSVHIEKPHVVNYDQLDRLICAVQANPKVNVHLGFNRHRSNLFLKLQKFLSKESGPLMINWFIAGHEISEDHWYFNESEGGRVLGNLCHWTDLTLHLVGMKNKLDCVIVPSTPPNAKSDFVVSIIFSDRSCAAISFSAKGHTFEGVREVLNLHRGDVLANLTDFQSLTLDQVQKKHRFTNFHRDHGHETNILNSYNSCLNENSGENVEHIRTTALFFLAIKDAIDTGKTVELSI